MKANFSLKNFFKAFSCYLVSIFTIVAAGFPAQVFAKVDLPAGRDDEFGENNIVFYNPQGDAKCTTTYSTSGTPPKGNEITWIGDSYSVGAQSLIDSTFSGADYGPSVNDASSYIQVSKHLNTDVSGNPSGISVLDSISDIRKYVVFALGTNDYSMSSDAVKAAIDTVVTKTGSDKKIILVTAYTKAKGEYTNVNAGLRQAKAAHNNIIIADWAAVAKDEYFDSDPDGIHPMGHYDKWFDVVRGALAGSGSTSGSSNCDCSYGAGLLSGDSLIEKIWNYIVSANITGVSDNSSAISGIIGNMWTETGGTFNPFIVGACTGLIQWCGTSSYNKGFMDYMEAKGLKQYFGESLDSLDPEIVDEGLRAELDFLFKDGSGGVTAANFLSHLDVPTSKNGVSGARAYSDLWLVTVENAFETSSTPGQPLEDPGVAAMTSTARWQGAASRREHAEEIYNTYASQAGSGGGSSSGGSSGGSSDSSSGTGVTWTDGWIDASTLPGYTKEEPSSGWSDETENRAFDVTPNKILLHSTEGSTGGLAAYPTGNHFAAHFTLDAVNKKVSQHYSVNVASNAVKSVDKDGIIQIEIVGFSQGHDSSEYKLTNWSDEEWDYVALVMTAIAEQKNISLTTSVDWANPVRFSSQEAFRNTTGVVGHMHAYNNDHTDPGNIWPMVSAALDRNPSASKFRNGGDSNCTGGSGKLEPGGYQTAEEANNAVMNEYRAITPRAYSSGYPSTKTEGDQTLESYGIANVNCSGSDLENCPAVVAWFFNKYSDKPVSGLPSGGSVTERLISSYGFSDEGHTPKVYAAFSEKKYNADGSLKDGHTGVVLGINTTTNKIIIGEAGCNTAFSWTGAHEYSLSDWTNNENIFYAYTDVNI